MAILAEMSSSLMQWGGWGEVGGALAWFVTGSLLMAGLLGCLIPILPGHLILFVAASVNVIMLFPLIFHRRFDCIFCKY